MSKRIGIRLDDDRSPPWAIAAGGWLRSARGRSQAIARGIMQRPDCHPARSANGLHRESPGARTKGFWTNDGASAGAGGNLLSL